MLVGETGEGSMSTAGVVDEVEEEGGTFDGGTKDVRR